MTQPYKFVRVSVKVFKVLAWVAVALQVITGGILLIGGGDPILVGGIDVPARVVGLLNFVAAAVYFFSLWLAASVLQLLLDLRDHRGAE